MFTFFRRARRGLASVAALIFCAALLMPTLAAAQSTLAPGDSATIANTGGDVILFRSEPGYDGAVIDHLIEGQPVEILDGPHTSGDGSIWYSVMAEGNSGYVASDFVVASGTEPTPVQVEDPVTEATTATGGSGAATTTSALNLREGPGESERVLVVIPEGASVSITGGAQQGFTPVTWDGVNGWASTSFLTQDSFGGQTSTPASGSATATSGLNFRTGPGADYPIIAVIPAGTNVPLTGERSNGFLGVIYSDYVGWASAEYLTTGDSGPAPAPEPDPEPEPAPEPAPEPGETIGTALVTTGLHLRSGPSTADGSLLVMPVGASVDITGDVQNGFLPVTFNGTGGWAYAEFLNLGGEPDPGTGQPPPTGGSGIIWPVSGGTWSIIQGYNGGTHQNRSASAQYYYALDIARVDGNTAGEAAYAPASGTVLWTDPGSGGIAIDMGNGYTIAMFHLTVDGSLTRGQAVTQGQYVGTISGPGGPGYASTPHIDMTLWQTGGGQSRSAAPYTGSHAVSGMDLPDTGGSNQHGGTQFTP